MNYISFILFVALFFYFIKQTYGHGYLADPPARSSAWLFDKDFKTCCTYYNHMQMFCGGTSHQWTRNGGKCSICGEAYDLERKLFDVGGEMYLGKIVRTYIQGSIIPVTVVLTANHLGIFEFRICNIDNNPNQDATQSCLDFNILKTVNGSTQYRITSNLTTVHLHLKLPDQLICKHCVFQWKYRTGNSWGISNGRACLGCGKENEEFYGCSDIAIISQVESIVKSPPSPTIVETTITTTTKETIRQLIKSQNCRSIITFSQSFDISRIMEKYCQRVCSNNCASDKVVGNEILYNGCLDSCNKLCACQ
ncbi:unnamed protein product [Rotaria sordida]|uniref:Chitin-binding type-4 domain-containing protein n=1 Tax=Rotaria sordida TaxID=392033 RepID=A0A818HKT2_9BILA|nr:unnamed protein product [Rotaria sordida]